MERTIDELKAEMEYWQAERERIDGRFTVARNRLWAAQGEARRNEKPTPVQIALLKKLAGGATLRTSCGFRSNYSYWWQNGSEQGNTSSPVYDGLQRRQLITHAGKEGRVILYTISDWGREVLSRLTARKGAA